MPNTELSVNKNTNILFIYHRLNVIGGIETRWMDEFYYLRENRYKVYFFTDKANFDSEISKLFSIEEFIVVDSINLNNASKFINLINQIISTIRDKSINVISIHMLDAYACAAVIAAQICRIAVISTIHGTPDIYRKPLERILFQELAGKSFSLSISVSQHLNSIFNSQAPLLAIIPNLINLDKYKHQKTNLKPAWLIVNRISPEKYSSMLRFLQAANESQISIVDIAGGGDSSTLRKQIKDLNLKIQVNFLGEIDDIASLIPQYSGVAGMGRVAIEGLACKKPVCIISPEGNLIGLVTKLNFKYLISYNFIGKTIVPISNEKFSEQLNNHTFESSQYIYNLLKVNLSAENWNRYIKLYKQVEFIDNKALESFYYKLEYFAPTLSTPFFNEDIFKTLLFETIVEYKLNDLQTMWLYYTANNGLHNRYPNPLVANKTPKTKRWFKTK